MISLEEFIKATKEHDVLNAFAPHHLERLAALAKAVRFSRNQIIFREGARHGFFYLILDGSVVLELATTGRSVLLQTLHSGDAMGWSSLLSGDGGAHFEARALTPVHALAFEGSKLREACESDPAFGYRMTKSLLTLLAERLDASRLQLMDIYSSKPGAARA